MAHELQEALYTLRERWQRTLLTMSGVTAATLAVVLLASIAIGVRADFTESLTDLGVNNLIVLPGKVGESFNFNLGGASALSPEIATSLQKLKGVENTCTWSFVGGSAAYKEAIAGGFLVATTPSWFNMKKFELKEGRLPTATDVGNRYCVIGELAAEGLFVKESALNKQISINGQKYTVIGVTTDEKSSDSLSAMGGFQNLIYIDYSELTRRVPKAQTDRIIVQISTSAEPNALIDQMKATMSKQLDEGQFDILTQKDLLKVVFKFSEILQWLLIGLTTIALFIGGIGIMNVMLLAVGERSTEIGIRKALGASVRSVFTQFLAESIFIGIAGSLLGITISVLLCKVIESFTPINPIVTWQTLLITVTSSMVTGALFGLIPALRAAKKDPVRAINNLS